MKPGDNILAYHRDKWAPGIFVKAGRKWATVALNGRKKNSTVPVDAVRPMQQPAPPAALAIPATTTTTTTMPTTAPPAVDSGLRLDEFDAYVRLIDGSRVICAIPVARRDNAQELLAALKAWRAAAADREGQP